MRILILLLVLLAAAPLAIADSTPHWFQVRTDHFVILTDSNEKQARHIASQFERMRAVFQKLLPNSNADAGTGPIVVLALKDKKSFQSLEPSAYLAKGQLNLAGLFLSGPDKNYILIRLDGEQEVHPFATIYHEYTHYMVRKVDWLPLWLNEGMAEFFQNTDINEKEVMLGEPSGDDILYLRQSTLLPLTTLLTVDHSSPYYHDEQKGSVFYAEAWALTHFLKVTDYQNHTSRFDDYVKDLAKGEDSVTAAQHAFGDLKVLQKNLEGYIRQGNFNQFKLAYAVNVDESTFKVQPISIPEADAIRADVLVDNDRTKDALALLDTVLRDDPKNAQAHETMGFLKFRENDQAAAKKWYSEAVQLDSQSYLAHYYFAALSMQSGGTDTAAIEASFREAIKLNPAFAPSYDGLAGFYSRHSEKLDEAHTLSLHAVQLEPENINYRLNAASVLMQQENFDSALNVLQAAAKVAKNLNDTLTITSRIQQVKEIQTATQNPHSRTIVMNTAANDQPSTTTYSAPDSDDGPKYPDGPPTGPHHTVSGVLHGVHCSYPTVLTLNLDRAGKPLLLYNNNFYKIAFSTLNYKPTGDIDPCTTIDGMKAKIEYGEVSDKVVAGQIISIELSK